MTYDKKVVKGWVMYDWANSVYSLTITTAIFPFYYLAITYGPGDTQQVVSFFGLKVNNISLYSYALSASFLIAAVITPLLSGIADYSGWRKSFMRFFCYLGSLSCISLYFFTDMATLEFGLIAAVLASVGFTGSVVFYNAYLPEIAPAEMQDKVSARGYAMGYIGSVILLLINLAMIQFPEFFFLPDAAMASRISFLMVGLWWFGFAQYTFARLPSNPHHKRPEGQYLLKGYRELMQVLRQLGEHWVLKRFLLAFFFLTMALQSVMYMAPTYAKDVIRMEASMLIVMVLVIQVVAVAGSYFFSWLSSRIGNLPAFMTSVVIWMGVVLSVYFITTLWPFMAIAMVVGFIMGGSQALARSTYSKLLPKTTNNTSFFSFYDVAEKVAIVLGTFLFGFMNELTGSLRSSLLPVLGFFVVGFIILWLVVRSGPAYSLARIAPSRKWEEKAKSG